MKDMYVGSTYYDPSSCSDVQCGASTFEEVVRGSQVPGPRLFFAFMGKHTKEVGGA